MRSTSGGRMAREPHIQWQGWAASVVLHAAIVSLVLAAPFNQVIDATDPFHWDVTLVETTVPAAQIVEAGTGGDVSPGERRQEPSVKPVPQATVSPRAVNRPNINTQHPVEAVRPIHRKFLNRTVVAREQYPLHEVKQPDKREVLEAELPSVVTERPISEPSTMVSAGNTIIDKSEQRQQHDVKQSEIRDTPRPEQRPGLSGVASAETPAIASSPAVQHPTALTGPNVVQRYPEGRFSSVLEPTTSRVTDAGGDSRQEDRVMQPGAGQGPLPDAVEYTRPGQDVASGTSEAFREKDQDVARSASSISGSGKGTGPDYSWLKRLLWESINRVKHYSDDAVENEWEGRVVMAVTIRRDGRIEEVRVTESSGNSSLDREAQELVARASPLTLDRGLGAERVKFRVPISFGLD